jgi:hypothetical protein
VHGKTWPYAVAREGRRDRRGRGGKQDRERKEGIKTKERKKEERGKGMQNRR